jgi:transcriptional regulator with XRE-family HTH domain
VAISEIKKVEEREEGSPREVDIHQLATLVRDKRGARGLREVAKEITENFGEVSASTLSRVEQGKIPDLDVYMRICRWLGASPSQFAIYNSDVTSGVANSVTLTTPQRIEAHLRADRELKPEQAAALSEMMRLAYEALAQGKFSKKGD